MIVALLFCLGCSKVAAPPTNPPPLKNHVIREIVFQIDGLDPKTEPLTLERGSKYPITASYIRSPELSEDWNNVLLLLVSDDDSENPAGIQQTEYLGRKRDETELSNGNLAWQAQLYEGRLGKNVRFNLKPGRYEIRLCWHRDPTTIAEYVAEQEDPESFLTPFYRTHISLTESNR